MKSQEHVATLGAIRGTGEPTRDVENFGSELLDSDHTPEETVYRPVDRLAESTYDTAGIQTIEPAPAVVDGYLFDNSLALPFGPSGAGKSFLAVEWALCVGTGTPWHDHNVRPGPVVYVVAEGAQGIGSRVAAWLAHHHSPPLQHPVHWLTHPVNLFDEAWVAALATYCEERAPVLVLIDTLTRTTVGADENAAKDMGLVVDHLDHLRDVTGACIAPLHHAGKDLTKGARGHTVLRAAMTTELEVTGDAHTTTIKTTKQRDAIEAPPLTLSRQQVGESCVLVPAGADSLLTSGALSTLSALREIEVPGGLSSSAWQSACDCSERTFYRHRKILLDCHQVVNVGTEKQPRYITALTSEDADDER